MFLHIRVEEVVLSILQDESTLIWYYGKDERRLELRHVSKIIPGQRTVSMAYDFLDLWIRVWNISRSCYTKK